MHSGVLILANAHWRFKMVYRVYVEKKQEFANEAAVLQEDLTNILGITTITGVRILNRYDVENIDKILFERCLHTVFSEPQTDILSYTLPSGDAVFAVEYLPGQFDQRASSAEECIQIISCSERPTVRTAKVYVVSGNLSPQNLDTIKKYVINPVEAREASLQEYKTLQIEYALPTTVKTLTGFCNLDENELAAFIEEYALAMDIDDIRFCRDYFRSEHRDPTITEIRMIDTYWSDHCRHTTFLTTIDSVSFEDDLLQKAYHDYLKIRQDLGRTKPQNLMDIATLAAKYLKKQGKLDKLDESEEINACTVKIEVETKGKTEKWLLLFKNETHNHPTEIEPFGGAATCIGGAIRDPLSGRSYVYAAMRVTGAANPTTPIADTIIGKLPQRKIVTTAANGYSSYGNQIGLATGQVEEIYHDGYAAKRMEIGAVIAAAPEKNVRRERPVAGDKIILLGGRTGRDGCGGATGSSKSHNLQSLESCGAEVQKGNAPEERKLQRLFRNPHASRLIKRCNDFGAGGVSVAIGELADGIDIQLDAVPKKYEGLDGTELAISESQERMAVVVEAKDVQQFCNLAAGENLEATVVATVQQSPYLTMTWCGHTIVNLSRDFLNSNGAEKHIEITPSAPKAFHKKEVTDFVEGYTALAQDLNVCSKRGLSERFDSTIGAGTVLMPFGGKHQMTPIQAMVHKISCENADTKTVSYLSWGYNPFISEKSPYHGAYLAVIESVCKLISTGAAFEDVYLTFQEYFEKPKKDGKRWGKPLAALLGAFEAQLQLGIAAIGGKDSMSGSFEELDVPPTLVSFAVTTGNIDDVISPEFKAAEHRVVLLQTEKDMDGLPITENLLQNFTTVTSLMRNGKVAAAYTPTYGGIAEAIMKMAFGNRIGFTFNALPLDLLFNYQYGAFILELTDDTDIGITIGYTKAEETLSYLEKTITLSKLRDLYENRLENIFHCNITTVEEKPPVFTSKTSIRKTPKIGVTKPKVLIPVFPGTNCEYDTAKALTDAGAEPDIFIINNLTADAIANSATQFAEKLKESQIVFIPGGFSGGDEPDGSGKFITAFFRNKAIHEQVTNLLETRDGLMCGICNGFQALIKLGLVPFGKIIETDKHCPTLTFNTIGRHQSKIVHTRVSSNKSPWMAYTNVGDLFTVPISHGEGRFIAELSVIESLASNGQILTQYTDLDGIPSMDIAYNPNGSMCAIEGITSPDGRIIGKMGHTERIGNGLYKNVVGNYDMGIFKAAVDYYKQ